MLPEPNAVAVAKERLSPVPSKYPLPPRVAALYGAEAVNGENVPCVVLPLRVMVKLLVEPSMNVLFCAPFAPSPGRSRVTLDQLGSVDGPDTGTRKALLRLVERVNGNTTQYPSPAKMWIEPVPDAVMYATVFWSCALDRVICVLGSTG